MITTLGIVDEYRHAYLCGEFFDFNISFCAEAVITSLFTHPGCSLMENGWGISLWKKKEEDQE
jgi:hypothetical protein